jgi:carboxyvinyl-carboxyphosphonate phosphorylmutase
LHKNSRRRAATTACRAGRGAVDPWRLELRFEGADGYQEERAGEQGNRRNPGPVAGAGHLVPARLTRGPGGAARLRALLDSDQLIVAPGAFDALSARLVEEAGFPAVYMTGFGTSAALLGRPDVGLLTMTEMAANAGRIAACVDIPVIADADTGYGNFLNVIRTVGAFEAAGVAGIHIEDQVAPKKCGHMEGKLVIPAQEMAAKIRAAVEARTQPEFVIIARTDARAVEGLERALERGRLYREAGADALFIEAVMSEAEAQEAARAFPDVPLLFNWAEGGKTPPISLSRLRELGYRIVIFPISTLLAATAAMRRILLEIAGAGTSAAVLKELPTFGEFTDFIGMPAVRVVERRYAVNDSASGLGPGGIDGSDV